MYNRLVGFTYIKTLEKWSVRPQLLHNGAQSHLNFLGLRFLQFCLSFLVALCLQVPYFLFARFDLRFNLFDWGFVSLRTEQLDLLLDVRVILGHHKLPLFFYFLPHFHHFLSLLFFLHIHFYFGLSFLSDTTHIVNYLDFWVAHHWLLTGGSGRRALNYFKMDSACLFTLVYYSLRDLAKLTEVNPNFNQVKSRRLNVFDKDRVSP